MPAIASGKVLVSGANGYIAVWVVKSFLDHDFTVRGTVRSESKAAYLRSLFNSSGDRFEVVIVEDITKEGAFDEVIRGVDAIVHTASPCHFNAVDPEEVIVPAVYGTTGILASALKSKSSVKRIVVTSSCAAVFTPTSEARIFSEMDWSEGNIAEVKAKGRDASNPSKYRASKALAEKAAWEFWKKHRSNVGWDIVCLNPPMVFGPFIHEVDKAENLNATAREWFETVVKGTQDDNALANGGSSYVDVRDLATAHVLTITKQEASGERIIVSAGPYKWQDFVSIGHHLYPELPAGNTSYDPEKATHFIRYNPEKQRKLLGVKFRAMEDTVKDTLDDLKARNWF